MRACFGSLVLSILSRRLIQFCLYLSLTSFIPEISSSFLMTSLLILSSLVYPVTLLRKRISAASRRVISLFVVAHVSLPYSSDGNLYSCRKETFKLQIFDQSAISKELLKYEFLYKTFKNSGPTPL